MKIAIPIILIILSTTMAIYFYDIDESKAKSWGWGVVFHATWAYCLGLLAFVVNKNYRLSHMDSEFLKITSIYCIGLGTAFVLNYYGFIEREYFLVISSIAIAAGTFCIVKAGVTHGLFKD